MKTWIVFWVLITVTFNSEYVSHKNDYGINEYTYVTVQDTVILDTLSRVFYDFDSVKTFIKKAEDYRQGYMPSEPFIGYIWYETAKDSSDIKLKTMNNEKSVIFTGDIPQCPFCKKPTRRTGGIGSVTAMYFPPVYDEQGNNTNPDRNTRSSQWKCLECGGEYTVAGNHTDGFFYTHLNQK